MNYGLIGERLTHSFSAEIHRQLFSYEYELIELTPDELPVFMQDHNFKAINVTIPYKEAVIPFLDVVDDTARRIGAVNTVVCRDGKLYGYNTDYLGLSALIRRAGFDLTDARVLILGSGGTSKTAMAVADDMGCREAIRVSRTGEEDCVTYEWAAQALSDADFVINTTPCGMYPKNGVSPLDLSNYPSLRGVVDVVYNPLRSRLVCDALERGVPAVGGLYMLVAQAAYAAELFTEQSVPAEKIEAIYQNILTEKENIVLVGMPASGKSSVGRRLAQELDLTFVDTDREIVARDGRLISEIFSADGESAFRDMEFACIRDVAKEQHQVIATGGGSILRAENLRCLRENGRVYFIDRSLPLLIPTLDRPLSSDAEAMRRRYNERYELYLGCSDCRIDGDGSIDEVVKEIREDFLHVTKV